MASINSNGWLRTIVISIISLVIGVLSSILVLSSQWGTRAEKIHQLEVRLESLQSVSDRLTRVEEWLRLTTEENRREHQEIKSRLDILLTDWKKQFSQYPITNGPEWLNMLALSGLLP